MTQPDLGTADLATADLATAGHAAAGELLRALAAPARVAIVLALNERAMCVHELVDTLHLNQPQVSQHLRVLKNSGVVVGHRRGREVEYTLVDDHIAHIVTDALIHVTEGSHGEGSHGVGDREAGGQSEVPA